MAIKYYAGNSLTGGSGDSKPTTLPTGSTFLETNTDDLYMWDGDSWNIVAGNSIAQTLSSKTFSDHITFAEISAPSTPSSGYGAIYVKSDNKLYFKNDGGTEYDVTAGAEGGEANEDSFKTIVVSGQDNVVADTTTDTLTLVAGSGMTITTTADTVTFVASAATLDGLTDTALSGLPSSGTVGHILVYDNSNSWDNKALTGLSGTTAALDTSGRLSVTALTALTDLDVASAADITILDTIGANDLTIGASGTTIIIPGNLTVSGTTTTVSTTNLAVEDSMIALAAEQTSGANTNALDVGFYGTYRDSSTTKYAGLFRDVSDSNKWKLFDTTGNSNAVPGTTVDTSSGFVLGDLAIDTLTSTQVDITAQGDIRLQDTTGGQYVGFQAPGTVSSSVLWTLPSADGTSGQVLSTDSSGTLSWVTRASTSGSTTLSGLSDTTITSAADASLLLYDTGTSTWRDAAMSGDATISDTGALTVAATAIEGSMLNSNTVDDSSIELASSTLNVKAAGVTNTMLVNSSITVSDGSNTSPVSLGGTLTFTATANETTVAESAGTVTIGLPSNVTIAGNLIVTGNSTLNGNMTFGNAATDTITINGTIQGASPLVFEGGTANGNETTIAITDPTADRTITIPDETGTLGTQGFAISMSVALG